MKCRLLLFASLLTAPVFLSAAGAADRSGAAKESRPAIHWKKIVLDRAFRSEGVAVADVNKDGKPDVLAGEVWYRAPDWKMHIIRKDRKFDPHRYSESFACFTDDFNGDGWIDQIVIPFPGKECYWYENPKNDGPWKEHLLTTSACNETPLYADLFGTGKRVLVMGWQPKGQENMGEMCWFQPGKDPTAPWQRHSISGPSQKGKPIPGTHRFSHGLGVGDVNGDGRMDVIVTAGWWEQPAKISGQPWRFHPAGLGPNCADMYAFDLDGDGNNDVISSSAHDYGMWWHRQQPGKNGSPSFVRRDLFPMPNFKPGDAKQAGATVEAHTLYTLINKYRGETRLPPFQPDAKLAEMAKQVARNPKVHAPHGILQIDGTAASPQEFLKKVLADAGTTRLLKQDGAVIGIGHDERSDGKKQFVVLLVPGRFHLFSQSHALNFIDMNGDGQKDLVTGRRWWAHGPKGDAGSGGPAVVYWFEARKGADGLITFTPHQVDDDSGIGTQFAVADINGDGLPDIIVANKKGVFVLEQVRGRGPVGLPVSPRKR